MPFYVEIREEPPGRGSEIIIIKNNREENPAKANMGVGMFYVLKYGGS